MSRMVLANVWGISDGVEFASLRVPIGGKLVNLPLILTSRENARLVMKEYPQLAAKNKIHKIRNSMVPIAAEKAAKP